MRDLIEIILGIFIDSGIIEVIGLSIISFLVSVIIDCNILRIK